MPLIRETWYAVIFLTCNFTYPKDFYNSSDKESDTIGTNTTTLTEYRVESYLTYSRWIRWDLKHIYWFNISMYVWINYFNYGIKNWIGTWFRTFTWSFFWMIFFSISSLLLSQNLWYSKKLILGIILWINVKLSTIFFDFPLNWSNTW